MKRALLIATLGLVLIVGSVQSARAASILFGATGSGGAASTLYTIDPLTGAGTAVGAIGFSVTGLAFDPTTGILFGGISNAAAGEAGLITINPLTGAGTLVGLYGTSGQAMADITFDAAGNLFGFLEPASDDLYRINKATGAATLVGDSPGSAVTGLAFDNSGTLYMEQAGTLITLSPTTGFGLTTIGSSGRLVGMGMDFNDLNVLFALERVGTGPAGARNLVTVSLTTGAATTVGATVAGLDALAFADATPVPEPATWLLLGSGLAAILIRRRHAKRS